MAGVPLIPITFFGKTRKLSETEFAVEPGMDATEVIEYVTNPDVPVFKFRASPAGQDDSHGDGGNGGDGPGEEHKP